MMNLYRNDGFCIKNDEFCIKSDESFINDDGLSCQNGESVQRGGVPAGTC